MWFGDGRYLLWSDIPNNRIMRWDELTGMVGVFRSPSNQANVIRARGRAASSPANTAPAASPAPNMTASSMVLADRFEGKRLNSPNDVVVKYVYSIWFTDPPYGILNNYNGSVAERELPMNVYRLDKTGRLTVVADDINRPNGAALLADEENTLYIVEDGSTPSVIRAYDVVGDGTRLANGREFIRTEKGAADGLRLDVDGNLWCGWQGGEGLDGVDDFNPAGQPIGHIDLPERCANVCFGGYRKSRPVHLGGEPVAICALGQHPQAHPAGEEIQGEDCRATYCLSRH